MSPRQSAVVAEVRHEARGTILVTEMVGRAGINVLMDHVRSHYDEWLQHDRLIYDVSNWDVDALTSDALRQLPESFKSLISARGKTWVALVIAPHLEDLARILLAIYESEDVSVEIDYFFDQPAAETWLLQRGGEE